MQSRLESHIRAVAWAWGVSPSLLPDMRQEAYLAVHGVMTSGRLKKAGAFESFARTTARNVASNLTRKEKRYRSLDDLESVRPLVAGTLDPLALLISMETAEVVLRCLRKLKESDREILRLAFFDGLAPREIAARLEIKESIARQRKSRALQRLKEVYRQESGDADFSNGRTQRQE